jgi:hypothetical protein
MTRPDAALFWSHPHEDTMSYALEEDPWRLEIDSALQNQQPIQFIVLVGRARQLAQPSVRRPPVSLLENRMA